MSAPSTMLVRAQEYLAERRHLGFELDRSGSLTLAFARFADASGHVGPLAVQIVLRWAKEGAARADPFTWAGRVAVLRPFARHLADRDPSTRFPEDSPFGCSHRRLAPHIYSSAEIESLIAAAKRLPGGLTPATFATLFGLLAASGMRISEALRLSIHDIGDIQTQITVHHSKFQRSRLVPLHPTATAALRAYLRIRAKHGSMEGSTPLFLLEQTGERLTYGNVRSVFGRLAAELGIQARGGHQVIRIHDLRHSFICRRLMLWQQNGADIGNAMMALSTYVGHVNLGDTYWYLQAVPDLMAIAGSRFEALSAKDAEVRHG
ncbi:putative integrase/recombinase y4rB [Sphingomonas glacialis]|uniref:Integrase/recombinase y4rB n=1 Tax=Sphingomonas glacialis TaxID=658225 RepID=A0ABQ3LT81_9SPHN|nr:tyrosine-type recombinase/integrase [Sphingomonas glacialis]GHH25358.1 putative integrase/recombinase y4rB [Sphingomonas glacialis]